MDEQTNKQTNLGFHGGVNGSAEPFARATVDTDPKPLAERTRLRADVIAASQRKRIGGRRRFEVVHECSGVRRKLAWRE